MSEGAWSPPRPDYDPDLLVDTWIAQSDAHEKAHAIERYARYAPELGWRAISITADEILECAGLAFVRGTYIMAMNRGPGTTPHVDRGHYLGLLRKLPDGSWLWSTDLAVSELPVPR